MSFISIKKTEHQKTVIITASMVQCLSIKVLCVVHHMEHLTCAVRSRALHRRKGSPATMECISGETGISPSISVPANCSTIRLAPREHNRQPSCSIARTPPILSLFHRTPTELPTPRSPKPARKSFFVNRLPLPLPASNGYDNTVGLQRCRKIRSRSLAACFRLLVQ
jgi:hypothetical protein